MGDENRRHGVQRHPPLVVAELLGRKQPELLPESVNTDDRLQKSKNTTKTRQSAGKLVRSLQCQPVNNSNHKVQRVDVHFDRNLLERSCSPAADCVFAYKLADLGHFF